MFPQVYPHPRPLPLLVGEGMGGKQNFLTFRNEGNNYKIYEIGWEDVECEQGNQIIKLALNLAFALEKYLKEDNLEIHL